MASYSPITITSENVWQAIRYNILEAYRVLTQTKMRVSRAKPVPRLNMNGNVVDKVHPATTLYSAVTLADLQAMQNGTFAIPQNPNAAGNSTGPGVYPSKPQGSPLGPAPDGAYGGRVLGDTAGDGN